MKSIQQQVHALIEQDLAIKKCLERDLINLRSLALFLIKKHCLDSTIDAVISALRRYEAVKSEVVSSELEKLFPKMSIVTKDGLARIVLKEKAFSEVCQDFTTKKQLKDNVRLIRAKETLTLIIAQKDLEKKLALFRPDDIVDVRKNISEIRLHFPATIDSIKGVFVRITAELALGDINIEEVMYSVPDCLVYVREEHIIDAHKALLELKKSFEK